LKSGLLFVQPDYITADQTAALKMQLQSKQNWKPLILDTINTGQDVVSIFHAPSATSNSEQRFRIRTRKYIAIRKKKDQIDLFDNYMYQVIVTNALWEKLETNITRHRKRCGTVEYAQQQLKSDSGMDRLPSNQFNVNAAWFSLGCLTHNILRFIQEHLLPEKWKRLEIKTLRFRLIRCAAIIIKKARSTIMRFCDNHPIVEIYQNATEKLNALLA
jgi:hypothetical protein